MSPATRLRLVTYNVRRFTPVSAATPEANSISSIAAALGKKFSDLPPSLLALNEVDCGKFGITSGGNAPDSTVTCLQQLSHELTKELGGKPRYSVHFFGHVGDRYGNALLANQDVFNCNLPDGDYPPMIIPRANTGVFPPLSPRTGESGGFPADAVSGAGTTVGFHLPGGSKIHVPKGVTKFNGQTATEDETHTIKRGMLAVKLKLREEGPDGGVLNCFVTHLDHISENERRTQLQGIMERIRGFTQSDSGAPSLLIGDFNAMTRLDYNVEEWARIQKKSEENKWGEPQYGCLKDIVLSDSDAGGSFTDLFVSREPEVLELESSEKLSAHGMYRIDYILGNAAVLSRFKVVDRRVLSDIDLSDHKPVVVDLEALSSTLRAKL